MQLTSSAAVDPATERELQTLIGAATGDVSSSVHSPSTASAGTSHYRHPQARFRQAQHNDDPHVATRKLHVAVVVLGDLGRSPRMQYHALSLLQQGHNVSLVGYDGEDLIPDLQFFVADDDNDNNNDDNNDDDDNTEQAWEDSFTTNNNHNSRHTSGPALHVIRFTVPTPPCTQCGKLLYFVWRIVTLAIWTTWALIARIPTHTPLDAVLVQNPPALPLLLVAWLYTRYKRIRQGYRPALVIDWHNLGYTMLAGGGGPQANGGLFARIARKYEQTMAPWADAHFTVTTAMRHYLQYDFLANVGVHSTSSSTTTNDEDEENDTTTTTTATATTASTKTNHPLHQGRRRRWRRGRQKHAKQPLWITEVPDCPPDMFCVRDLTDQHEVLTRLGDVLAAACPRAWKTNLNFQTQTLLTEVVSSTNSTTQPPMIQHRRGRPALVTSSTSWTPDEDFGILLQALLLLDDKIQAESSSLNVLVVVTGKGPQKTMYERKISQLGLRHVAVTTLWLAPQDYPRLLAAADLGVSLHTSTSGLDLPMKVLDLFGCEVPVCAMQFACLDELVQDGVNGRVFANSAELANVLWELLSPLADRNTMATANHDFGALAQYSTVLRQRPRWHANWQQRALPVLEQVVASLARPSASS